MTIKDIARLSGYGIATVSRVLNNHEDVSEKAREKILRIVNENNFKLNNNAKHLKQQKANIVALIVRGTMNELFAGIVEILVSKIREEGYISTVRYIDEDANEIDYAKRVIVERSPVAIFFLGGALSNFQKGFASIKMPSVLITLGAEKLNFENLYSVTVDDRHGATFIMSKLLDSGHKKIGFIGPVAEVDGPADMRFKGIKEAFFNHNLEIDDCLRCEVSRYSYESAYNAMNRLLLKMPDITAVCCVSDVMAIGAMRAIKDAGKRIPQDISITGYDGINVGQFSIPRLTTIKQDRNLLANKGFEILKLAIDGDVKDKHIVLPYEFLEGESMIKIKE